MAIKRRDFLNGMAIAVGAIAIGCDKRKIENKIESIAAFDENIFYPPSQVGLRGNHEGSFEVAHELSWKKKRFDELQAIDEGKYDLVVVGAGISGLTAAYLYHQKNPNANILILDNHDDFGGHARRCEMNFDNEMKITFAGSESFDSPKNKFNKDILDLLKNLGIDYTRFNQYYDQNFNNKHNLSTKIFFNKEIFGRSVITDFPKGNGDAHQVFKNIPLSEADRIFLASLFDNPENYLQNIPKENIKKYLSSISYDKFLQEHVKAPKAVLEVLQDICLEYWGFPIDHLSALDAFYENYPAMKNLDLENNFEIEPYIYHFPDGNASVARLLVRSMIPKISTNQNSTMSPMENIVLDRFDYTQLDQEKNSVKIRLLSTVVFVANNNNNNKVDIRYQKEGKLYQVTAKHCILACNHRIIQYLVPELKEDIAKSFNKNVKVPLIYTKVLLKDWKAFKKLGANQLYCPRSPYCFVMLDYPVSMGGYEFAKDENEPMIIHMTRVPVPYKTEKNLREACQIGRFEVYTKQFSDFENDALKQLSEIFSLANEDLKNKVVEVVVHRWGHGYSYEQNILYDTEQEAKNIQKNVQTAVGNIHFANSDASWTPYMHGAIIQAFRAVREIQKID